jgi:hypothetical protein
MPEKSGMGVAVCAHTGAAHPGSAAATAAIAAIAKKRTNKRKSCRQDVMISSPCSPSHLRASRGKRSRRRPYSIGRSFGAKP